MANHPPIGEVNGKAEAVESMFDAIAPRYDLLNRILSLGIDQYWRRQAVDVLSDEQPGRVLDVATGTADLAVRIERTLHPRRVMGVDASEEMLRYGRRKVARMGLEPRISLVQGIAEDLPFRSNEFDAALVAFGVRNFEDLDAGLRNIQRVVRPGGRLVVLEFSRPRTQPLKRLYGWYSRRVLPHIGGLLSPEGGEAAYEYLPSSVAAFPDGIDFLDRMSGAGYTDLLWRSLTFGIASLYCGLVPGDGP